MAIVLEREKKNSYKILVKVQTENVIFISGSYKRPLTETSLLCIEERVDLNSAVTAVSKIGKMAL